MTDEPTGQTEAHDTDDPKGSPLLFSSLTWGDWLRFWRHVNQRGPADCWPWTASRKSEGHGEFRVDKRGEIKKAAAHRLAWLYANHGESLSSADVVAHTCDNPPCCNPAHLFKTDPAGNRFDCVAKGRHAKGEDHGHAVLTESQVSEIRLRSERGESSGALGNDYGVHRSTIGAIVNRKSWRHVAAAILIVGSLLSACTSSAEPRPNVLLVVLDDARADEVARVPALTELAARGISYQRTFAAYSLCAPSRANILSGNGPARTGVRDNHGRAFDATSTIAVWLHAAGYFTGLAGQYLNKGPRTGWPVAPGWDFWRPTRMHSDYGRDWPSVLRADVSAFLDATGSSPWFFYLAPTAPHGPEYGPEGICDGPFPPLPQPPNFDPALLGSTLETRRWPQRLSALCGIDILIRGVVSDLEARGLLENTLIVVTSDQGFSLGERGLTGKYNLFEEVVRVPLVIAGPGFGVGSSNRIVSLVDLAPTLAELVGVPHPEVEGRSFLTADARRFAPIEAGDCTGKRRARSKVTWCGDVTRLYDLAADPFELAPTVID